MRGEFEDELDPFHTILGDWFDQWSYWMHLPETRTKTYRKILVPLDRSIKGTGAILELAQDILDPEGQGILLHVIPPAATRLAGSGYVTGTQADKHERSKAMGYLNYFADQQSKGRNRWHCEVAVSASVANAIADFARQEKVDLIAMYTHGRRGLAKLIKGSVAEKVQQCASTEVRVLAPQKLVTA